MKSETCENQMTPEQEARTKLRESFLKAVNTFNGNSFILNITERYKILDMYGERCTVLTYEQSSLTGTFSGWRPDGLEILFHDVKTPANIEMKSALLRTPDVLAIQFEKPIQLPF